MHRAFLPVRSVQIQELRFEIDSVGARCTATLLHEMKKRGKAARFGVVSMCIGSGMGAAAVFEQGGEDDDLRTVKISQHQGNLSMDAIA